MDPNTNDNHVKWYGATQVMLSAALSLHLLLFWTIGRILMDLDGFDLVVEHSQRLTHNDTLSIAHPETVFLKSAGHEDSVEHFCRVLMCATIIHFGPPKALFLTGKNLERLESSRKVWKNLVSFRNMQTGIQLKTVVMEDSSHQNPRVRVSVFSGAQSGQANGTAHADLSRIGSILQKRTI